MSKLPKIAAVSAAKAPFTLHVTWGDGKKDVVNLTGLVSLSKHFRVFLADPKSFRKVRPTEFGGGIEWSNGLDYSADSLMTLADEQKPMTGKDLVTFEKSFALNSEEMAGLLDVTPRSIHNWRKADELPALVSGALRKFERDKTAFAAHYRPIEVKPRGRPKAANTSKR